MVWRCASFEMTIRSGVLFELLDFLTNAFAGVRMAFIQPPPSISTHREYAP